MKKWFFSISLLISPTLQWSARKLPIHKFSHCNQQTYIYLHDREANISIPIKAGVLFRENDGFCLMKLVKLYWPSQPERLTRSVVSHHVKFSASQIIAYAFKTKKVGNMEIHVGAWIEMNTYAESKDIWHEFPNHFYIEQRKQNYLITSFSLKRINTSFFVPLVQQMRTKVLIHYLFLRITNIIQFDLR